MRPGLERGMKSVPRTGRLLQVLAVALLLGGITAVVVGGFVEGRDEAEQEALRQEPIKPPLRVTKPEHGEPIITLDAAAQHAVGLQVATLPAAKYQDQVRAYGAVLDLTTLTTLNTNYVAAVSQLNTAQARLAASQPAFARAQALYAKNIGNLVQVQATEAAVIADRAAVEAAQSQVRTLRATALQEWGPVIGNSMVVDGGLITRLIERNEFLLQITLPPGVRLDEVPNAASVEVAGEIGARRGTLHLASNARRPTHPGPELLLRGGRQQRRAAGNERPSLPRQRLARRRCHRPAIGRRLVGRPRLGLSPRGRRRLQSARDPNGHAGREGGRFCRPGSPIQA